MIARFFRLAEYNTDIRTECLAGLTTFMTMLYIVPVNALILSKTGMPQEALLTAIALITIVSTIVNGVWANTPIAMSVGLGLSAYFTYGLVLGMGVPWQTGLGIVTLSGSFFVILSITPIRHLIITSIPNEIKRAISAGIGVFISFVALREMGIIVSNPDTLVALGNLHDPRTHLSLISMLIVFLLVAHRVQGAFVLAVVMSFLIGMMMGLVELPERYISLPSPITPIAMEMDVMAALNLSLVPVIVTFVITDVLDSLGTLAGVGLRAGLFTEERNQRLQRTLEVDAFSSVASGITGVSTTTSFIESAAGIEAGGRTGLTAVVTGLLFITTLFFLPVFQAIPEQAIYPVLVMVGIYMFSELQFSDLSDVTTAIPAFLIIILMPLTFSITYGMAIGFITYTLLNIFNGDFTRINLGTLLITLLGFLPLIM